MKVGIAGCAHSGASWIAGECAGARDAQAEQAEQESTGCSKGRSGHEPGQGKGEPQDEETGGHEANCVHHTTRQGDC